MLLDNRSIILLVLFVNGLMAQQMPIDFSDNADNFIGFANSSFSFATDPEDSTNSVGQFFNDGSESWQGFYIDLASPIDLNSEKIITLSFYAFDPNVHNIYVKLEQGSNPDIEVVRNTSTIGWTNNISFDFSNATISGTSTSVNATGSYSRLTIFIDGGETVSGTYLIDNIDDGSEPTDPYELDVIYNDLVWADEFDTNGTIDSNNWFHQTQLPAGGNWFNGEEQHYTNRIENSFVEDGFLNIVAKKESFTDQGETKQYTSARLNSKFAFTYGRVDVRAKLPFGEGTWPAIWTLGKNVNEDGGYWDTQGFGTVNWPGCGEIDIMEHGLGETNHVSSALHTPSSFGNTINVRSYILNDVANEFHVYSMNWSPDQITFLIDGVGFYTYNPAVKDSDTWPFFEDQYLLLNVAMGGISGAIDSNFTESSMVIDYVRIYQNSALGIEDKISEEFRVYPNPATSTIKVQSINQIDRIELYNSLGQLVLVNNHDIKELNLEDIEAGIYLVKIYSENTTVIKKVAVN
ncbi:family 16 glycosylhydrolase [Winogradskyella ursingii]|uniref:family 16 glycosylhydrolase n=1 Tax=Winogradskyella ursingii TaxID=2686079 RepID=UPI001FE5E350|nr:family 16 glycosylhydrolase [Winogradskyella ursingii]